MGSSDSKCVMTNGPNGPSMKNCGHVTVTNATLLNLGQHNFGSASKNNYVVTGIPNNVPMVNIAGLQSLSSQFNNDPNFQNLGLECDLTLGLAGCTTMTNTVNGHTQTEHLLNLASKSKSSHTKSKKSKPVINIAGNGKASSYNIQGFGGWVNAAPQQLSSQFNNDPNYAQNLGWSMFDGDKVSVIGAQNLGGQWNNDPNFQNLGLECDLTLGIDGCNTKQTFAPTYKLQNLHQYNYGSASNGNYVVKNIPKNVPLINKVSWLQNLKS